MRGQSYSVKSPVVPSNADCAAWDLAGQLDLSPTVLLSYWHGGGNLEEEKGQSF